MTSTERMPEENLAIRCPQNARTVAQAAPSNPIPGPQAYTIPESAPDQSRISPPTPVPGAFSTRKGQHRSLGAGRVAGTISQYLESDSP